MFVFRSLVTGFAAGCFVLVAMYQPPTIDSRASCEEPLARAHAQWAEHEPTLIDVAPSIASSEIASLVRLEPGEHVATVDDTPVESDLAAGAAIASHTRAFVDLGVVGPTGTRRVLLLLH